MRTIIYEKEIPEVERVVRKGKITPTDKPNTKRLRESDSFHIKFKTIKERIISILREDKFARRNDLWLLLRYYHKMGYLKLQIDVDKFNKIHMPESISRGRRAIYKEIREGKLPELKFLLKDEETLNNRELEEESYRDYFKRT